MLVEVGEEGAAYALIGLREVNGAWIVVGNLVWRAGGVLLAIGHHAEQRKKHVVGRLVCGVKLKDGSLEVLHVVGLAVYRGLLFEQGRDRIALLQEATILGPV